jgi:hypothetical protein
MQLINWEIAKHPMNWVIVLLMLIFAGAAIHIIIGDRVHTEV